MPGRLYYLLLTFLIIQANKWLSVGRTDLTDILSILQYSLSNTRGHCLHLTEEERDGLRLEWSTTVVYCILHRIYCLLLKEIVCETVCNEKCFKYVASQSQTHSRI